MKLHHQTLQQRPVDDAKRQEFYQVMVDDCDRLLGTVEQVLRAGPFARATGEGRLPASRPRAGHERVPHAGADALSPPPGELTYRSIFPQ